MDITVEKISVDFPAITFVLDKRLPKKLAGIIKGNTVRIDSRLSSKKMKCTMVEEAMHWKYTSGNIIDQKVKANVKQEIFARRRAHYYLIPLDKIKECHDLGLSTYYEVAEYLDVTEEFLHEAVESYREKYGLMYNTGEYIINFGSTIEVFMEDKNFYPYDYGC